MTNAMWKDHFEKGVAAFRASNLDRSLDYFNQAILAGAKGLTVYDSRAAVLEKLGQTKDALKDSKTVIDIAPTQWQGYARSSRLFLKLGKHNAASTMADMALDRLKPDDTKRRAEMNALKRQAFDAKMTAAVALRREHSKTFYHFGKLPVEVVATIFGMHVAEDAVQVLTLSQVSRRWRDIAVSTPALWDALVLSQRNPVRKAKVWKERSKGRIRVLSLRSGLESKVDQTMEQLADLSWECLRTLHIHCTAIHPSRFLQYFVTFNREDALHHLHRLSIDGHEDNTGTPLDSTLPTWFRKVPLPSLQVLELRRVSVDWQAISHHVTSLVSLSAHDMILPSYPIFAMLQANPLLESLSLSPCLVNQTIFPSRDDFSLSLLNLKHLDLASFDVWANFFFKVSTTPNLQTLKLCNLRLPLDDSFDRLLNGEGGLKSLTHLRIERCGFSPNVLMRVLQAASALETLELVQIGCDLNDVVEALVDPNSTPLSRLAWGEASSPYPRLCPQLTYLHLPHCPSIKTGPIIRLVKSRLVDWPSTPGADGNGDSRVTPMKSLVLDGCSRIEADSLPWLRSKVPVVSCVYLTKKAAKYKR
ncbi:hypothetical protein JAAARDRAFT_149341 [Jaapia argillacea MUCL 33604]|uniref:F-box domain-containing protein n=1 Tax=Jaapia argillacea MUCL 33604 TaxID=933084 RepID=A0A067QIN6_9AGAM|nr:hypothetical protein JAAARDRAFT_149341 [Jaapia argillacea MUCL 33604]